MAFSKKLISMSMLCSESLSFFILLSHKCAHSPGLRYLGAVSLCEASLSNTGNTN